MVLGKNPQFFKLLTDALQYSLEAFKLFSHVRAEERVVDITYLLKQVMEATIAADIALTWQLSVPVSDFVEAVGPCDTPEAENRLAIARLRAALLDGDSRAVASPSVQDAQEEFLKFFETVVDALRGRL